MDIKITERKFNPFLDRDEVRFEVLHEGEATPPLAEIRKLLRAKLNSKAELMVLDGIYSHFGLTSSSGFAKVYKSEEALKRVEADHILRKNFGSQKGPEETEGSEG